MSSLASGIFFFLLNLMICLTVVAHFALSGLSPMAPSIDLSLVIIWDTLEVSAYKSSFPTEQVCLSLHCNHVNLPLFNKMH